MSRFTELLIKARESKKMTKSQVAEYFNWTPMYYGRYENGYLVPRGQNINRFADFIGISPKELEKILSNKELNK
jgi:transcriptional regulator with XRE-family HTH domain